MSYEQISGDAQKSEPKTRTRVAFVLPQLYTGGAERVLISLMNGLDRSRFDPELIAVKQGEDMRELIANDIPFHALDRQRLASSLPSLLREIRKVEPDIIFSTMAHMNFALLMLRPALRNVRMIVREANIPSSIIENVKVGKPWMVSQAYKRLYPSADMIVSPSQCIIDEFRNYLGMSTNRHRLLHNPVDVQRIRSNKTSLPVRDANTVNFIAAGRLHHQKGFDRLIDNLDKLKHPNWRLDIYGAGEELDNLKAQILGLGLESKVFLRGLTNNPWPAIASADCFLLPSRWEGLPNVVLESLAAGTKVIATAESGGIAEIAALTRPGDVRIAKNMDAFIEAMNSVRPAPEASMRPSLLPEHFTLERVNKEFAKLLTSYPANQAAYKQAV